MKFTHVSPVLSLGFAVMLLLSVAVHPVMAADATKKQLDSFNVNDIKAIAVDELVSDPSGSLSMMSASSEEDFQEFQQGKVHVRAKDPLADQHSSDIGKFSASSVGNGDPVDAQIAGAIANLSREGYDPSGQTEHRYQSTLDSDKFRNIDSTQRAVLETKGLHIDAMDPTALTMQEDMTYYFFTNPATNATRVMTVVQLVDKEGTPAGERKMTVSEDIVYSKGDDATEYGFSASVVGEEIALVPLVTEATPLLAAGAAGGSVLAPIIIVVVVVIVVVAIILLILWWCGVFDTPPAPQFSCTPTSGVAPLTIQCTDQSTGDTMTAWNWDFGDSQQSTDQNPSHVYTRPAIYTITLTVTNDGGTGTVTQSGYTVTSPLPDSSIVLFGNISKVEHKPTQHDYSQLGGASAIQRSGAIETFIGTPGLTGTNWVQATNGAAINRSGTLFTWSAGQAAVPVVAPGKEYVAVSRFIDSDWLLAIYRDDAGLTHLETLGNSAGHPEVFRDVPTSTGWRKIAAGNEHALALSTEGKLYAWGRNDFHQCDLPADKIYTDIDAGRDFSVVVTEPVPGNLVGHGGSVYASGKDDFGQVTGMNSLTPGDYIAIAAGTTRAAAITHDGTIITKGESWTGTQPPAGTGFTDIALGPDNGFAIKESAPELHITGPLSPGKPVECLEQGMLGAENLTIPYGSTIEHTDHEVTRIIRPDGTQLGWANDKEAEILWTPWGKTAITTNMIMIPEGSYLNSTAADIVTLKNAPLGQADNSQENILTIVYRNHARSSQPKSLPKVTLDAPSYVEWAEMSRSSMSNFASFKTSWTIPLNPQYEVGTDRRVTSDRTEASVWNGIQQGQALIQVVPAFNWYYPNGGNFDGKWSWAIWGGDSIHTLTWLTTPKTLSAGDAFWASYSITSTDGSTTHWSIDTSKSDYCLLWDTTELSRTNGELDVALEAYLKARADKTSTVWDSKYLPKNTKLTDFEILDTSGNTISPAFTGVVATMWKNHIPALNVDFTTNPYTSILKTEN